MYLGKNKHKEAIIIGIKITTDPIKCLGIYVGNDSLKCYELNWDRNILNLEKVLEKWGTRHLTIFGKVTIIKTLAMPKITYVASCCTFKDDTIRKITRLLYSFIWGKKDRIKRNVLISPITNGGVNMIDVESHFLALKAVWVNRILSCGSSNWGFIAKMNTSPFKKNLAYFTFNKIDAFPLISDIPEFYRQVIYAFARSKDVSKPT